VKKVLVTGGSGFLGRHTLSLLNGQGYDVHVAYRNNRLDEIRECSWHRANLLNYQEIISLIQNVRPQYLLHLAWDTTPEIYWNSPENINWVQASLEMLKAFHKYGGKRIVAAGSCAEYEWNNQYCRESSTPFRPNSLYGVSKHAFLQLLEKYCKLNHLSYAWGYIFYLYGPHEKKSRLIPMLINGILNGETIKLSSKTDVRDYLYVEDAASAFVQLLSSDYQGTMNISSGQPVSVVEIVNAITDVLGGKELIHYSNKKNNHSPNIIVGDNQLLLQETRWRKQYNLVEGLRKSIDWWKFRVNSK